MPITARERRLLLDSRTLTFHMTALYSDTTSASAVLTTVKGWDSDDKVLAEVAFDLTQVDHFGGHGESLTGYVHVIGGGRYDEFMQTWLKTLRTGSKLRARWVRSNQSPVLNEVGWFCDEFSLATFDPEGRNGKWFKVSKYVGPDNTARMTRLLA